MGTMYLICGVPASEKDRLVAEAGKAPGTSVVSLEGIRRELYPGEPYRRGQVHTTFQLFHERMVEILERGDDLVIDDVARLRTDRARHLRRAKHYRYKTVCIFCDTAVQKAIADYRHRPTEEQRKADKYYIRHVFHSFEEPDLAEGWDEIYRKREQPGDGGLRS